MAPYFVQCVSLNTNAGAFVLYCSFASFPTHGIELKSPDAFCPGCSIRVYVICLVRRYFYLSSDILEIDACLTILLEVLSDKRSEISVRCTQTAAITPLWLLCIRTSVPYVEALELRRTPRLPP